MEVLRALRDRLPSAGGAAKPPPSADPPPPAGPARAVVRIERKGRGGKEATIVEKLELNAKTLELWLDEPEVRYPFTGVDPHLSAPVDAASRGRLRLHPADRMRAGPTIATPI